MILFFYDKYRTEPTRKKESWSFDCCCELLIIEWHLLFILAFIKYIHETQIAGLLRDVALFQVVWMKPSVGGVLNHQTLPCLRQDTRLLYRLAVAHLVCALQHRQLVRKPGNRGQICDGRFFTKVKHHEERSVEPVQLPEVREDVGIGVDGAEPPTLKGEL